jgi:hypothetical protein
LRLLPAGRFWHSEGIDRSQFSAEPAERHDGKNSSLFLNLSITPVLH